MKILKNIFLSIALVALATACSQDLLGELVSPDEADNREIHFVQKSLVKEFKQGLKTGEFVVTLARNGNAGTYRVVLQKSGKDAALFSLRDTVVIPDGKYAVDVPVTVDLSRVVLGSSVSASLTIIGRDAELSDDAAYISQYSDFLDLSASFELEWEPYMRTNEAGETVQQTATYYYSQFYEGVQGGMLVERAKGTDNIFRLLDWAAGAPFTFRINKDKSVVVPGQSTGYFYDQSNEYVQVADAAQYFGSDAYYSSFPCTFDGKNFSVFLIYYVSDGFFGYGYEQFRFDGDHDFDPTVSAIYDGAGQFSFEFGSYTSYCKAVVVPGNITTNKEQLDQWNKTICLGESDQIVTFNTEKYGWTPAQADNTLLVVPFDEEGVPGKMLAIRFTYDPAGAVLPKVNEFKFEAYEKDPYETIAWTIKTENAARVRYKIMEKDILDYFESRYELSDILNSGSSLNDDNIIRVNSEGGLTLYFQNLSAGTEYRIIVQVENKLGDAVVKTASAKLKSHVETFATKSLDDFVGAYLVNATVTTSDSSVKPSTESYRVDIIKVDDNTVSIKGLCNYKLYSPALIGNYIPEISAIRVQPQSLGEFSYLNVVFGYVSNLYSGIWSPENCMEFGFTEDGLLYWRTAKTKGSGSEIDNVQLTGYKFMLFDGDSYVGYAVADKTYTDVVMKKL